MRATTFLIAADLTPRQWSLLNELLQDAYYQNKTANQVRWSLIAAKEQLDKEKPL